jgi:hypothetical protein
MNGDELAGTIRSDRETALSRLGSSKALYAATGGEMDGESVRTAVAAEAARAARVFAGWADDEADADAAALFADVAEAEGARREDVAGDVGVAPLDHPMYDALAALSGTEERLGGLLARSLVARATVEQAVGFFVGDADPRSADEFRSLKSALSDQRAAAVAAIDDHGGVDEAAADAARAVVDVAYDHYVERLESMGIKPKNVC